MAARFIQLLYLHAVTMQEHGYQDNPPGGTIGLVAYSPSYPPSDH